MGATQSMRYDEKIRICKSGSKETPGKCDHFDDRKFKCDKCKCFLAVKARLPFAKCPLNKW